MLFFINSALVCAFNFYAPNAYKPNINALIHLLTVSIIYFFDKDVAQMKNEKIFSLIIYCFLIFPYYLLSLYTPTLIFFFKINDITYLLSKNFNLK